MDEKNVKENKEIFEINNKKYTVITRQGTDCLGKDKLVQLILNYALRELRQEDF